MIKRFVLVFSLCSLDIYTMEPTFHLKNNSTDTIQIEIIQGQSFVTGLTRIAKNSEFSFALDISKPTTVNIHFCPSASYCKTNKPDTMVAKFKAGKTIYVKFDGNKVEPQKGSMLSGKTTSGYSLKNNVASNDISIDPIIRSKTIQTTPAAIASEFERHKPKPTPGPEPKKPAIKKPTKKLVVIQGNAEEAAWKKFPAAYAYLGSGDDPKELARLVLGVNKNSSQAEIKKAYHKAALKYHPDHLERHPDLTKEIAEAAFKIINTAQNILIGNESKWRENDKDEVAEKQPSETRPSKKDELLYLLANPPEFLKTFGQIILNLLLQRYDKTSLSSAAKKVEQYPAQDFGTEQRAWKKNILSIINEELTQLK